MFKLHLISGLPRSGSTLLSGILKQNPRFVAGMTTPVDAMWGAFLHQTTGEFSPFFTKERKSRILTNILTAYYGDQPEGAVIFDTNRRWTTRLGLLNTLYPEAKVICCVREIGWILDSFERAIKKDPLTVSRLIPEKKGNTVYGRTEAFMDPDTGLVGSAWSGLREAWFGEYAKSLIILPYERLATDPKGVIGKLYEALGEDPFTHDFNNVEHQEEEYDLKAGTPDLHTVKRRVALEKRDPIIPPDIFKKFTDNNFWMHPNANIKGVTVL